MAMAPAIQGIAAPMPDISEPKLLPTPAQLPLPAIKAPRASPPTMPTALAPARLAAEAPGRKPHIAWAPAPSAPRLRSEEHTSELQSQSNLVCRLLLEKKKSSSPMRAGAP